MAKVNGRRAYDTSSRQDKARLARGAVVRSARKLFENNGYRATTIAGIADDAGVSPESVYKAFGTDTLGTKAAIVKEVFDFVIAGDDEPVAVADRPDADAVRSEPDVRRKIHLYVAGSVFRAARSALVQIAIRDGRHSDPGLDVLWTDILDQRLVGMTMLGRHLLDTGGLRYGIDLDEVRDVLWTYTAVEQYELLVLGRGWALDEFSAWLDDALAAALLGGLPRAP